MWPSWTAHCTILICRADQLTAQYRYDWAKQLTAQYYKKRGPLEPGIISTPNESHWNAPKTSSCIGALTTVPSYDVILLYGKGGVGGHYFYHSHRGHHSCCPVVRYCCLSNMAAAEIFRHNFSGQRKWFAGIPAPLLIGFLYFQFIASIHTKLEKR